MGEEVEVTINHDGTLVRLKEKQDMPIDSSEICFLHHLVQCFTVESIEETDALEVLDDFGNLIMDPALSQNIRFSVFLPKFNHHYSFVCFQQIQAFEMAV